MVIAGRLFLRRVIDTAYSVRCLHHWVNLNANFRCDLEWWYAFLEKWNGRSMMEVHDPNWNPDIIFSSDVSGSWGCGAVWQDLWIQCPWNNVWSEKGRATKGLLPSILAIAIWVLG